MEKETLFINGRIYSLEKENEVFGSMLISGGTIKKLYSDAVPEPSSMPRNIKTIDLGGRTVLPGFIDCHSHFIPSGAIKKYSVPVSEIADGRLIPEDLDGVSRKLKAAAAERKANKPLLCVNYIIPSIRENRLPTSSEIDAWLPERPVIILSMDGHSSSYSSRAIAEIGLKKHCTDGILTGEAHEFNMGRVNSYLMKSLSIKTLLSGITANINDALANGLTGIHCLEGFEDDPGDKTVSLLTRLAAGIPLNLRLYPQYMSMERVLPLAPVMLKPRVGGCGSWEMDGSVSSHSAAFYTDYVDAPGNQGKCYYTLEEILPAIRTAQERGFQITAHAIGPRGIELILTAFETVLNENGDKHNRLRHRIDHFEFPTNEQLRRAANLGIIITVQPGFSWMDEKFQKSYHSYLSRDQYESQIALKTFSRLGGIICGGSDSPVQHQNPFIQIHGMVNFPIRNERLSVFEALRTYTLNAAFSTFEEDIRGSIVPGKAADFIIIDQDPFRIDQDSLIDLKVISCFIGGKNRTAIPLTAAKILAGAVFNRKKKI